MQKQYVDHKIVTEKRGDPPQDKEIAIVTFDLQDHKGKIETINLGLEDPSITRDSPQEDQLAYAQDIIDNYAKPVTPLPRIVPDFTDELRSQIEEIDFDAAKDLLELKELLKQFQEALLGKRVDDTARIAGQERV